MAKDIGGRIPTIVDNATAASISSCELATINVAIAIAIRIFVGRQTSELNSDTGTEVLASLNPQYPCHHY